jgi:hypothetical protein
MISIYGSANDFIQFLVGKTFANPTNHRSPMYLPLPLPFLPGFLKILPMTKRRNKLSPFQVLAFFRSLPDGHTKYGPHVLPATQMYEVPTTFAIGLLFTLRDQQLALSMTG